MTGRNADAVTQVTGAPGDAATRAQADMLKQGYSPEAAGIVRDNATPQERAQDIADFQNRAKQVSVEAAKAADTHANQTMEKLAGDARHANEVLEATKATGDPARTAKAQAQADAANKAVIDYHETRTAAQNAAVANDGDAAKIVNEARGGTNEGKSPSQIREAATLPDRKALTGAAAEPTKAPTLGPEPVKGPGAEPVKTAPGEAVPRASAPRRSRARARCWRAGRSTRASRRARRRPARRPPRRATARSSRPSRPSAIRPGTASASVRRWRLASAPARNRPSSGRRTSRKARSTPRAKPRNIGRKSARSAGASPSSPAFRRSRTLWSRVAAM
jgi:hypothetical protein